jgi:hypothetical protein
VNSRPPAGAIRLYKRLLYLYPAAFREEFGDEMLDDFADATGEAWMAGRWPHVLALWALIGADFLRSLMLQWVRSGWPALVGISATSSLSYCVLVAQQLAPRPDLGPPRSRSEDEMLLMMFSGVVVFVLIAVTIIVTAAFWALVVRRKRRA